MKMDDEERRRIIEEVAAFATPPTLAANEFTVAQYAESQGLTMRTALDQLNAQYREGKLERRKVMANNRRCWAFSLKKED